MYTIRSAAILAIALAMPALSAPNPNPVPDARNGCTTLFKVDATCSGEQIAPCAMFKCPDYQVSDALLR